MTATPSTPPARPMAPRYLPPATAALFAMEAADKAFEHHIATGQGNGSTLLAQRASARAAYLRACRQDSECKQ